MAQVLFLVGGWKFSHVWTLSETSRVHVSCELLDSGWTVKLHHWFGCSASRVGDSLFLPMANVLDRSMLENFYRRCDVNAGAGEKVVSSLAASFVVESIAHLTMWVLQLHVALSQRNIVLRCNQ